MQEEAKTVVDSLAVGGTVATLAGWLPAVASLFTIIWLALRNRQRLLPEITLLRPIPARKLQRNHIKR
jgi:hypothetical protein